jgi:hypothetical protein
MEMEITIKEMIEDFPSLLNLRSRMFIRLQKMRGGYWDKKKFKDYFQIRCLAIIYFILHILLETSDRKVKNKSKNQEEMKITRRKIDDPALFKNYFESYPF